MLAILTGAFQYLKEKPSRQDRSFGFPKIHISSWIDFPSSFLLLNVSELCRNFGSRIPTSLEKTLRICVCLTPGFMGLGCGPDCHVREIPATHRAAAKRVSVQNTPFPPPGRQPDALKRWGTPKAKI